MGMWKGPGITRFICSLLVPGSFATFGQGQDHSAFSRRELVARLREVENKIHRAEADYTFTLLPAKTDMKPLIGDIRKSRGESRTPEPSLAVIEHGPSPSCRVHWIRSGTKEWRKSTSLGDRKGRRHVFLEAFDGRIVWSLSLDRKTPLAFLRTPEGASWWHAKRAHPFSSLCDRQDSPYSEIVATSSSFDVREEVVDGKKWTSVEVDLSSDPTTKYRLFFDEQYRLLQRQVLCHSDKGRLFEVCETDQFLDWVTFENKEGPAIAFPSRLLFSYYLGRHPNGVLLEHSSKEIKINRLVFNPPVADWVFAQNIPASAEVYDGLTDLGYLQPGNRPAHLFPEDSAFAWWWTKATGISLIVGLVLWRTSNYWRKVNRPRSFV